MAKKMTPDLQVSASNPSKWYEKKSLIIGAFLLVGPLALPLVWMNSRYSLPKKIIISAATFLATWAMWILMKDSYDKIMAQYSELQQVMKGV